MFMNVLLPEPDGPMTATNSPGSDRERDAVERAHLDLAHLVDADEVLDPDDVVGQAQNLRPPPGAGRAGATARRRPWLVTRPTITASPDLEVARERPA